MLRASVRVYSRRHAFSQVILSSTTSRNVASLSRNTVHRHIPWLSLTRPAPFRSQTTHPTPPTSVALFHSTQRRHAALPAVLLGIFKASSTFEIARTVGRIALTFVPIILFKNRWTKKIIKHHHHLHPDMPPVSEEKKAMLLKRLRSRTLFLHFLLFVPAALLWVGIIASAEQTPLTGRWRLIILSPEEEDDIAAQLVGPKWYQAVTEILSNEGSEKLIPTHDWRYHWVRSTLERLESAIPTMQCEHELNVPWLDVKPGDLPLPPPAQYPLKPRPRGTDRMRSFCDMLHGRRSTSSAHVIAGPPYSLLIADRPDAANAFSYGFGPDGACGIVVYSGFLDEILSKAPPVHPNSENTLATPQPQKSSWLSHLFGTLFTMPPTHLTVTSHPIPTEEQTTELAVLLAHEVAHLVLSHHIETLSSGTVIIPVIISMAADVGRTLLFPITMLFGPFFNDAIAQLGKVGSGHLSELGEYCTSIKQEIEADVVSARLLAYAGFDARKAVEFWESRRNAPISGQCSSAKCPDTPSGPWSPARPIMGTSHPLHEERIERLKSELVRWELEKRVAMRMRAEGKSSERSRNLVWGFF